MSFAGLAWVSIGLAVACALVIAVDEVRRPQRMGVMNVVWPVTALYFSIFALWAYFAWGTKSSKTATQSHSMHGHDEDGPPTFEEVAVGTSHCGAGCMIADVGVEFAIAASGLMWFGSMLATEYVVDFVGAWTLGIVFQYFAIKPTRKDLTAAAALRAAIKADTLSIVAFQVGMYAFMALMHFVLFPAPHRLTAFDPRYWALMQLAMICGFATSLPMNRLLIGMGWKERM
jgi:hypothetical protein